MLRINAKTARVESKRKVAIAVGPIAYNAKPPFCPDTPFPEYPFRNSNSLSDNNKVYETVRESFRLLGLDTQHFGLREWNPLGEIIRPGETVVLKPNFVRDFRETQIGDGDCLITHGSVIRAVLDYVYIAVGDKGRIIIADAPQNDADFDAISRIAALTEIRDFYRQQANFEILLYDLRPEKAIKVDGIIVGHKSLPGDPAGYVKVNLGYASSFSEVNHLCHLLYGSEYDTHEIRSHHYGTVHEYLISKTILDADCVISLAKLKTHKKTGVTLSMKNMVGINGNKNWLPHHRQGTPNQGGDQFPDDRMKHRIERRVVACFKRIFPLLGPLRSPVAKPVKQIGKWLFGDTNTDTIRSGNWYGNDTTWRMVLDLNRIVTYADSKGQLHDRPVRRLFNVVDGIIGGEGNGPLDPTPKPAGVIIAGVNPVAVDLACVRLMGFDYRKIPLVFNALNQHQYNISPGKYEDIQCISSNEAYNCPLIQIDGSGFEFQPHFGWKGHIEVSASCVCKES